MPIGVTLVLKSKSLSLKTYGSEWWCVTKNGVRRVLSNKTLRTRYGEQSTPAEIKNKRISLQSYVDRMQRLEESRKFWKVNQIKEEVERDQN